VTSIGDYTFGNCSNLTSLTISNGVIKIGYSAFRDCSSLTSVTIPNSVTRIVGDAFNECSSLTSITVDAANANYSSEDGVLFNKAKTTLVRYPEGKTSSSYAIPEGVTGIDYDAFFNCSNLTSITIPGSVTEIKYNDFRGCSNLTSITFSKGSNITNSNFRSDYSLRMAYSTGKAGIYIRDVGGDVWMKR